MPKYSFQSLSDADFEELVRDLLQQELGMRLEAFTSGRDGGIDLRYSRSGGSALIVQCKHYERSGFAKLKSVLLREELPKVRLLSPERYILCTSVGLTPDNKEDLLRLLAPFCHSTSDILGREDLNNLLACYPKIETNHHKLWLTSVPVLEKVLHAATFFQIGVERSEIERKLSIYVQTPAYDEALDVLDKYNYCIRRRFHSQRRACTSFPKGSQGTRRLVRTDGKGRTDGPGGIPQSLDTGLPSSLAR
jgi:hypothetical protein